VAVRCKKFPVRLFRAASVTTQSRATPVSCVSGNVFKFLGSLAGEAREGPAPGYRSLWPRRGCVSRGPLAYSRRPVRIRARRLPARGSEGSRMARFRSKPGKLAVVSEPPNTVSWIAQRRDYDVPTQGRKS
jgi:hypothetical protein